MTTRNRSQFIWLILVLASLGSVQAQDHENQALLERVQQLEERARERDQKIDRLQGRLADYENGAALSSELESCVNALQQDQTPSVHTKKSEQLTFGGQVRLRGEFRSVKNYGALVDEGSDFVIQRTRFHADFQIIENVRAFIQLQDARNWGEEGAPTGDLEGLDIHQAYVEYRRVLGQPWSFRVGRQELSYGDQRVVSPLDWHPVSRAFDGVKTWWEAESFQVDAFVMTIAENSIVADGEPDDDHIFAGLYFHYTGIEKHEIDAYLFYRSFASGTFSGEDAVLGDLEDFTFGLRFKGKSGGFDYSAEMLYQCGDRANDEVSAYAWAATLGFTFDCDWQPRIGAEWTFASGDDDPTDGDLETFDPLFPFGHSYQGFLDLFAWKNGHDIALKLSAQPNEDLWLEVACHFFLLDSDRDAWYNAGGGAIRRVGGGVSNEIGYEIDLHAKYQLDAATHLWFGYSHFFAGDYVSDTGASPDTDWVYFQMTVNF